VELRSGSNFSIPSPRPGHVLINVNVPRDFRVDLFADIGCAEPGAACSRCGHPLQAIRGVEVAHIFKLGSRYTDAFGARAGARSLQMSCYGLGATRLMATVAEQRCDARGLVWPRSIAPFLATIVPADPAALPAAVALYTELRGAGDDVLLDDTSAPYADKLAHADLRGIRFQLIVSADHGSDEVIELRERAASLAQRVRRADVAARLYDGRLT
jgi:prolyl-tRNA synthetase